MNREELLLRAKEVGQLAEKYMLIIDEKSELPQDVADKIIDSGFTRIHRPQQYGGQYLDYYTFGDIIRTVAYHNVSAAWITYFAIIHDTWAAFLPKKGREEIFATNDLLADVLAPVGKVTNDGDGYRLSGQWNFCSGVLWSDWIGLGAVHQLLDGDKREHALYIVHKDEIEIVRNWDTIGLRGTGSHAVKVEDVYVPPYRVFPIERVVDGATAPDGNYDKDYQIFNVPYLAYFYAGFPWVLVGGLERLVDEFEEKTKDRIRIFANNVRETEDSHTHHLLGELKMKLHVLTLIAENYMDKLTSYEANGIRKLSEEERQQLFAMRGFVAKEAMGIATRILTTLGGNSIYKSAKAEAFVRDIIAVATHPNHLYNDAMKFYGKTLLGYDGHPMW